MSRDELAFAGVARQAEMVRSGEVSARELTELYLERIARLDPHLNSYRLVLAERALADAEQADARRRSGDERPLLGVPLAVKDNMDMAGEVTTHGGLAHGGPALEDGDMVRRLRSAGAVLIGKTTLPELAIMGDTESPVSGITRNPWDTSRSAGGSSGGSAAAVAAGLCAAATASDGAGSIRIPAAMCGVVGLKPQRDRISLAPLTEHWYGMSVYGFETRTVADTALLVDVVAARSPERPLLEAAARPPERLRVALSTKPSVPGVAVHAEVRRAVAETGELLRSLGHEVAQRDPEWGDPLTGIGSQFLPRYFAGIREEALAMPHAERLSRRTKGFARLGAAYSRALVRRIRAGEGGHTERLGRLFHDHDVLITPVAATPPVVAGRWEGLGALRTFLGMLRVYPYCAPWNATGQPAAAVPAGFTPDGWPLSVQLVGRPHDEATLLSLAAQLEAERRWADRRPQLPVS